MRVAWRVMNPGCGVRIWGWSGLLAPVLALLASTVAYGQEWLYTVRPGDNLWNITTDYLTRLDYWPKLQALNRVADPENLPPGMKLRIPIAWLKRLPATAQILHVQGQAQAVIAATSRTVPVAAGLFLQTGDTVRTGPDSNVTLEFGDGSRLLLQAESQLIMETLSAYGPTDNVDTRLRLQQGRVESQVTARTKSGPRYEIWTPAATSAVRGTRYRLGMDSATTTARAEVLEGVVSFQGRRQTRTVPKGFGALAQAGKPPAPPVPLLAPPNVGGLPPVATRVPVQLSFPALPGAVAYRGQVAPTDRFETLLFDGVSPSPAIRGPDLPDGDYVLRVRGIDARGLEGRDAQHRFRVDARPEPPFLINPAHQSAVLEKDLVFEWSEPQNAAAYHFQLAADEDFMAPLLDVADYTKSRLIPDRMLEPGRYFWRVAVRDSTGEQGPFGDPQSFRLQPTPRMQAPEVTADAMTFRWSAGLPGQQYQFQLARDVGFEDIVISTRVSEPQLTIRRPESGFHYLRMRVIDTDGYVGPYGPVQRIDVPPASYWPYGMVMFLTLVLVL
ncbi:MAG TPA: LysM peptidoglycan-binding domain-containing protein [Xanthomonadaceae bacterium]|nr:LysM peptidoglycan-binding domain-containing protein [Xanthomonadaceae bacterium]